MKLEFKGFTNPLTNEAVRAMAIVLGVIVVISAVVYAANFGKRRESNVLPTTTQQEATTTAQPAIPTEIPTITPLTKETPSASPSPTKKVPWPTWTPVVEGVTVIPTPTI